ncbi:MAG: S8 family serine peptidase [Theionarchaea archaeon]|nr:S8 family serine peptidase [Theionarchaea archaeon]MBU7021899.1 S8 family serine peptidase [Theionarchaea archaeon]
MLKDRKVVVYTVISILLLSVLSVNAQSHTIIIHVQTFGYEGRDLVKMKGEIVNEDSHYFEITCSPGVLARISKEINIEKLPVVQVTDTTYRVPKDYLTEIGPAEYVALVPNDVARIKWNLKDKIKGMPPEREVTILVMCRDGLSVNLETYGTVTHRFMSGKGASLQIPVAHIRPLSEDPGVLFLEDDFEVHMCLSQSIPLINADDCWSAGYDGTGTKICIIDTGIDPNHCDFPSGKIVAWADFVNSQGTPYDDNGHGTHCASIAAGEYAPKGVAPGASLMGCKVLTSAGSGSESTIIAGIDWAVNNGADIISMSLGGAGGDGTSALAQESDWAVDQGVVVATVVGGEGACCTVGTPGDARKVITVTASDKSDALASFNSRGPTTDGRIKPDIAAPGVSISAADAGTSCSDVAMSGSSMAAPHIAGVAALMLDARGTATPLQIKNCLGATAIDKGNTNKDCLWGWGRVDAYAAVIQVINNPNVSPPPDGDCGCSCDGSCLGTALLLLLLGLGTAIRR